MKVALYIKHFSQDQLLLLQELFLSLKTLKIDFILNKSAAIEIINHFSINQQQIFAKSVELIRFRPDFFVTIGGDGTFLDSLHLVKDSSIPVVGINTGRLGFLANNSVNDISNVLIQLNESRFNIEKRTIIQLITEPKLFGNENFALNDFTIHKRDNSSLTAITTYLNGEFFNTYWGDGIIVSTPTGSTAYSMSCGGPIVFPESNNFIITPVAPHNLNVRPVIVPDNVSLSFEIKGRDRSFLVSLDSRYKIVDQSFKLKISKAGFLLNTIRFNDQKFSQIIREKLSWGIDSRNI